MKKYNFNNYQDYYPIVLLPNNILKNLNHGIEEDIIKKELNLKEPNKRKIFQPEFPSKYKKISFEKTNWFQLGCLGYTTIICSVTGLFIWWGTDEPLLDSLTISFMFVGVFSLISGAVSGSKMLPETNTEFKDVEKTIDEYEQELLVYNKKSDNYQNDRIIAAEDYRRNLQSYNNTLNEGKTKVEKKIHHKSLIPHKRATRIFYPQKRGFAELEFLSIARKTLKDYLFLDMEISQNTFYPDITLICPETHLHIDIEIDEPYSLSNKLPIHCSGEDKNRNNYFLDHNWCVIRFAEEQVVKQPEEAVKMLCSLVKSITNMEQSYESNVRKIKVWDYEDAAMMANKNYRQKYLPSGFQH